MISNLIVPMAGTGQRFVRSGYKTYKPFLKLPNNKTIIESIVSKFDIKTKKIFIINNELKQKYIQILKKIPNNKIIYIDKNKLGPGFTIYKAKKSIGNLKSIYVCYSDILWNWEIPKKHPKKNIIYCFKGWSPFTRNSNNYAFCKLKNKKFYRIKEKSSFTNNWLKEPLSVGLFYYKNSSELFKSIDLTIKNNIKINNEFFPSIGFNFLKNNTEIKFVKSFVHIGKPEYYEEFCSKFKFFLNQHKYRNKIKKNYLADQIIIPAAGKSERFKKENIFIPKYLYKIQSLKIRLIELINRYLPDKKKELIILNSKYINLINRKKFNLSILQKQTTGQAETVFNHLLKNKKKSSIFLNSCDVFSIFDLNKFEKLKESSDIIIFVSKNSNQELSDNSYSWVEFKGNRFINIFIKRKPKKNLKILTGNFYFRNENIYKNCFINYPKSVKNEIYIDNIIKVAKKLHMKISVMEDDIYINLGTPQLINDFIFWFNFFNFRKQNGY